MPRLRDPAHHQRRRIHLPRLSSRHLDAGEDSVGTKVNWEHVGPALLGADITISIKVVGVDGRRVTFEALVDDGADAVARGTHERFIVDVQKVRERLLRKAKRG